MATARGIDIREASHLAPAGAPASIVLLIVMPPPGQCERFHQRATQLAAELLASGRLIGLGAAWAHPAGLRSHAWNAESLAGAATDELRGCFAGPPPGAIPSEGLPETLEWLQMKFASRPDTARGLLIALVAPQTYELAPDAIWHSPEGCWAWQAAMRKSIGAPLAFASIVDGDAGSASRSPFLEALARLTALGAQARSSEGLIRCWSAEEPLASVRDDAAGLVALADSLTARHQAFMERQPLPADRRLRVVANSGTIATRLRPVTSVG